MLVYFLVCRLRPREHRNRSTRRLEVLGSYISFNFCLTALMTALCLLSKRNSLPGSLCISCGACVSIATLRSGTRGYSEGGAGGIWALEVSAVIRQIMHVPGGGGFSTAVSGVCVQVHATPLCEHPPDRPDFVSARSVCVCGWVSAPFSGFKGASDRNSPCPTWRPAASAKNQELCVRAPPEY